MKDIFPSGNRLPNLIAEINAAKGYDGMTPGESTWIVPWMLHVDDDGLMVVARDRIERGETPHKALQMKLVRDFGGLVVNATAYNFSEFTPYIEGKYSTSVSRSCRCAISND